MHRSNSLFVGAGMLLSLCPIPIAAAQTTWYVDDDRPPCCYPPEPECDGTLEKPFCKIQDGINAASDDDEVIVLDGTYSVDEVGRDGARRLWFGSPARRITLRSQNGPQNCTIDCEGTGPCRAFDFYQDNASRSTVVEGFTIKGGYVTSGTNVMGGGIRCVESEPTIRGCVIEGNQAPSGGGIGFKGHPDKVPPWSPLVTECTIRNNRALYAWYGGGGIYSSYHSDADIVNSSIVENTSPMKGGGIYWDDGSDLHIVGCAIVANTARFDGGGVYGLWKNEPPTRRTWIKRCTILRNWVEEGSGGGVAVGSSQNVQMWMVNNVIAGNEGRGGESNGGGLAVLGWGSRPFAPEVHLVNVLFAGNVAREGGGVYMTGYMHGDAEIADCTVVGNVADSLGGGIRRGDMPSPKYHLNLSNIIVWDNVPSNNQISEYDVQSFIIRYSDVAGVVAHKWDGGGNINADPLFAGGTSGTWTSNADCNSAPGKTKFFDNAAEWTDGELVGKLINPDTAQHLQSVIVANEATSITVWGDFCNLGGDGELDEEYQANGYRLAEDSPCIDAAGNHLVPEDVTDLDQDENTTEKTPRDIVMGPRHLDAEHVDDTGSGSAPVVDMGAYEFAGQIDDENCDPRRGVIDARQPHPPGDCSLDARQGFGYGNELITIAFAPPIAGADDVQFWNLSESGIERQSPSCLEEEPPLEPNEIATVSYLGDGDYEIELERPISAGFVTTISLGEDHSAIYASLPADVSSDCTSGPPDILYLIDCLNGVRTCEIWQCDMDRVPPCRPPDMLRAFDLHNGAGLYTPWLNVELDPNICQGGGESAGGGGSRSLPAALTRAEANAEFMDGFVEYLTTSVTWDVSSKADFELISDSLTWFCVDNLSPNERATLADKLQDPSLTFASPLAEEMVPDIVYVLLN